MAKSFSIVTATLNHASFIGDAIRSVLDQRYPNLEYIVIDGGSTDGSVDLIRKYSSSIHYFVSEKDAGHANALNKGFRNASGEIMGWINSDDKYLPWAFRTASDIFEEFPDINWIVGTNSWLNDKGAMIGAANTYNNIFDYLSGKFFGIQQESVFWRRPLWEKAGASINEHYRFMVDAELWTRFFLLDELWHVNCVFAGYRMHQANRAITFRTECISEISQAISAMRGKLDPNKLTRLENNYRSLSYDQQTSRWVKQLVPRQPNG